MIDHQSCKDRLKWRAGADAAALSKALPARGSRGRFKSLLHRDERRVALRFVKAPAARARLYFKY